MTTILSDRHFDWDALENIEQLNQALDQLLEKIGYDTGSFIYAPVGKLPNRTPGKVFALLNSGFRHETLIRAWSAEADPEDNPLSHTISPTWRMMLNQTLPQQFFLQEMLDSDTCHSIAEKRWLKALIELGFSELCVTPVHASDKSYFALSCLKRSDSPVARQYFSAQTLASLLYVSHQFARICQQRDLLEQAGSKQKRILSPRESECLLWSAKGKSAAEIADILSLQTETIRSYIKSMLKKLNADNKAQAIAIGYELGLLGGRGSRYSR